MAKPSWVQFHLGTSLRHELMRDQIDPPKTVSFDVKMFRLENIWSLPGIVGILNVQYYKQYNKPIKMGPCNFTKP